MKKNNAIFKKLSAVCAILSIFVMTTSFATVIKGSHQPITFESDPVGASVYVDGQLFGKTPLTVNLKKNKYSTIMVRKDGYSTQTLPLTKSFDAVALLDVLWDYSTTDMISGAAFEYEPNKFFFKLDEESDK